VAIMGEVAGGHYCQPFKTTMVDGEVWRICT